MRLFKRTTTVELSWRGYRALRKGGWRSTVAANVLILFGIVCFLPGVPEFLSKEEWLSDWMSADSMRCLCILTGLGATGAGAFRLRLRLLLFRSRGLIAQDDLAEELAADAETLDAVMRKRNIQPRLILNGRRFYKRSDFGEMPLLLRPSEAPSHVEGTLLRPIQGICDSSPEHLLRPVVGETTERTVCGDSPTISEASSFRSEA